MLYPHTARKKFCDFFFEKLAVTLERISQKPPQYEELAKLFNDHKRQPSQRLKASLCNVHSDLFRFFQSIVRIFTKKNCSTLINMRLTAWN